MIPSRTRRIQPGQLGAGKYIAEVFHHPTWVCVIYTPDSNTISLTGHHFHYDCEMNARQAIFQFFKQPWSRKLNGNL